MIPPDPRILKIWNQKVEVNVKTVTEALDQLAHLIVKYEEMAEQMLPIYERLERELAALQAKETTIDKIRARALAAAQSKHQTEVRS